MNTQDLVKGTLKTIILKLLMENSKMYGYEITQAVKRISEGKIKLNYGALYPALHKLEADGLLSTSTQEVNNRLRKYYSLTKSGKETAKASVQEYATFSGIMDLLILSKTGK